MIKYVDKDDEMINVSDDEDLQTAYEVAELELDGNLKFVIDFKKEQVIPKPTMKDSKKAVKKEVLKAEKKEKKDKKKDGAKKKKAEKKAEEEKKETISVGQT